ncbi:MAG TPA: GNAT family N-acetyltransferase [Pyrinomonadaceae bacterium]|nr:GNAT family N-acetyltransferase [Pyrinomonadaceae bacterium]
MDTSRTGTVNKISLRTGRPDDAEALGRICYEAFVAIAEAHSFPPDFPAPEVSTGLISMLLSRPDVYSVVAVNAQGKTVGSNFLWESDTVSGVGPVTVDVNVQNSSYGRALMEDVIRRSDEQGHPSIRLVQAAFHSRSLSLYTKLGFDTVEPLSNIQGAPLGIKIEGYTVRKMTASDLEAVDAVAYRVHGHTRHNEVSGAIEQGTAYVVEHGGRITGYTTGVGFFGHSVGETNLDLQALIGAAENFPGPGFLLPTRNSELLRWCLSRGLRIVQPLTLMSRGLYQEPRGAFLPSILF